MREPNANLHSTDRGAINDVSLENNSQPGDDVHVFTDNSKGSAGAGDIPTGNHPPASDFEPI